jgi:hypothetical protein
MGGNMRGREDMRRGRGEMRKTSDPATTYGRTTANTVFFVSKKSMSKPKILTEKS